MTSVRVAESVRHHQTTPLLTSPTSSSSSTTGHNDVGYTNRTANGSVGGRGIITPHINALADEGIKLARYYVQEMCTPTRAALLTGRYPLRYGMTAYTIGAQSPWGISQNETYMSELLQRNGYMTGIFGKCT